MFELLTIAAFLWLTFKAFSLFFRLTWGIAKIMVTVLITLALPALLICLLFAGGISLLIPILLIGAAAEIAKHSTT